MNKVDITGQLEKEIELLKETIKVKEEEAYRHWSKLNKIYGSKAWKLLWIYKKTTGFIASCIRRTTPVWFRKRIKAQINKILKRTYQSKIDEIVRKEWQSWEKLRKDNSFDLINFGIISYDYRIQRPQHLAQELSAKGHRVFYIDHEFLSFPHSDEIFAPIVVKKRRANLYKVSLSASRELFIYRDLPSKEDKKVLKASLKNLFKEAKIINPVAKVDHPFWGSLLEEMAIPVIYDCMDEHLGFKESSINLEELERHLYRESEAVLVSSKILEKKALKNKANKVLMLKNAGEYDHFVLAAKKSYNIPEEIINIPRPIIGYYGAISSWFDAGTIENLATKFGNCSIVLIGRVDNSLVEKLARRHSNIYLLGEKPYDRLPAYLQEFDVCTIPFIVNDLIKATNPVKIYEYFAAGKPVVATNIPELIEYKDVMYISKNTSEFIKGITKALKEDDSLRKKRQELSRANTWETRGKVLSKFIENNFFPKVSVVVLSYNSKEITKGCIRSILKRSFYPNLEVVVVDNASDKETVKMLRRYTKDPRVVLIENKENLGFAAGNNIGMKKATGEYIILLNNDTVATPGWTERLLFHAKKENVGLVGPVTNNIGNEAKIEINFDPQNTKELEEKAQEYTYGRWGEVLELKNLAAFCWIQSKNVYQKIGGLDERFGTGLFEDDDYCMRIKKEGLKILCAEDAFVHHYGGSSTKWQSGSYRKLFEENKEKFESKWKTKWTPHQYRK